MELNDLLNETSECTASYKNYTFKMQVFTEKLTPEYKARLIALTTANEQVADSSDDAKVPAELKDENAQMLSDLIDSWDVVLKGEAYPPTYANFLKLSYPLMAALIKQITMFLGDLANPQSGTN